MRDAIPLSSAKNKTVDLTIDIISIIWLTGTQLVNLVFAFFFKSGYLTPNFYNTVVVGGGGGGGAKKKVIDTITPS